MAALNSSLLDLFKGTGIESIDSDCDLPYSHRMRGSYLLPSVNDNDASHYGR